MKLNQSQQATAGLRKSNPRHARKFRRHLQERELQCLDGEKVDAEQATHRIRLVQGQEQLTALQCSHMHAAPAQVLQPSMSSITEPCSQAHHGGSVRCVSLVVGKTVRSSLNLLTVRLRVRLVSGAMDDMYLRMSKECPKEGQIARYPLVGVEQQHAVAAGGVELGVPGAFHAIQQHGQHVVRLLMLPRRPAGCTSKTAQHSNCAAGWSRLTPATADVHP